MVQINRRRFISQAALTTIAAGLALDGLGTSAADAQIATILSYAMGGEPLLALVSLFEAGYHLDAQRKDPTTTDIVNRIDKLSQEVKNDFDGLAKQLHKIVGTQIRLEDLRQDTVQLAALSYSLNIATTRGAGTSEVIGLSSAIDASAFKLGSYGVTGIVAYLNAIALQNSVHSMIGSSPKTILAVNKPHEERIGHIIYTGDEPDSFEHAKLLRESELSNTPYYRNFNSLKYRIGETYRVGVVSRFYEANGAVSTCDLFYAYNGFRQGQPTIVFHSYGPERFAANINRLAIGRPVSASYLAIGSSEAQPLSIAPNGGLIFPQNGPSLQMILRSMNQIADEYRKFYDPGYGPEINARMVMNIPMTPEQTAFRSYLINTGLGSVKRIIAVAEKNQAAA